MKGNGKGNGGISNKEQTNKEFRSEIRFGIDLAEPGADSCGEILMITNEQRRKIFGYTKAAWGAEGAPGAFDDWRHEQQQLCGVSSLRYAPRETFFKLVQHYRQILRGHEDRKRDRQSSGAEFRGVAGQRRLDIKGRANMPLLSKIEALLTDMSLAWEYADGIAGRMFGAKRVEHCTALQMRAVIAALVKRQQKKGGRWTPKKGDPQNGDPQNVEYRTGNVEGGQGDLFPTPSKLPY